jgi:hypothetical protein
MSIKYWAASLRSSSSFSRPASPICKIQPFLPTNCGKLNRPVAVEELLTLSDLRSPLLKDIYLVLGLRQLFLQGILHLLGA